MIAVCNCNGGNLRIEMVESLLSMFGSTEVRARAGGIRFMNARGLYVPMLRDYLARRALDADAEWMLTVDSDMAFSALDVIELLRSTDEGRLVVGAMYSAPLRDGIAPVAWTSFQDEVLSVGAVGMCEVEVVGTGLLLVHRSVLERVLLDHGTVFDYAPDYDQAHGEDVNFCRRARASGFGVFVNADVRVGHVKDVQLHPSRSLGAPRGDAG